MGADKDSVAEALCGQFGEKSGTASVDAEFPFPTQPRNALRTATDFHAGAPHGSAQHNTGNLGYIETKDLG